MEGGMDGGEIEKERGRGGKRRRKEGEQGGRWREKGKQRGARRVKRLVRREGAECDELSFRCLCVFSEKTL